MPTSPSLSVLILLHVICRYLPIGDARSCAFAPPPTSHRAELTEAISASSPRAMGLPKEDVEDDYLRRRLVAMGITDFEYVRADEDPHNDADASDGCGSTVKIKTLIWEAILEAGTATTTTSDPHVFAVALREEDRVDVPALQGFVRSDLQEVAAGGLNEGEECRLIVRLAETSVAERRTGYISGTIPPVGHVRPMPLYVDEGLVKGGVVSPPTSTSEPSAAGRDEGFAERPIEGLTLSAGSGVPGRSLRISPAELLRAASASAAPVRVRVRPISSSSASEGAGSPPPGLCRWSRETDVRRRDGGDADSHGSDGGD